MHVNAWPEEFVEPWDDIYAYVECPQLSNDLHQPLIRVVRESKDDPINAKAGHQLGELCHRTQHGQVAEIGTPLLRRIVNNPEQPNPIFGVLEQLSGNKLADVSRANDDSLLQATGCPGARGSS